MAASADLSAYQRQYDAADRLYDEGLLGQCIAVAKYNLGYVKFATSHCRGNEV